MRKIFLKEYILFLLIFGLSLIFSAFLIRALYPIHLQDQKLIFFDLIEFGVNGPFWFTYFNTPIYILLNLINIFLIWIIAKNFFIGRLALIPVIIYGLSPWSVYLAVSNSFYIYLLCCTLITFLGILLIKSGRLKLGFPSFVLGSILFLYSSLLSFLIYPMLIAGLCLITFVTFQKIKFSLFIITLLCLPLLFAGFKNQVGIRNIYKNQITLFADPGYINSVNVFQGESSKAGFSLLAKVSENKYIYASRYTIFKAIKYIMPSTFFTSQESLLNFSFAPPIYFGFFLPFLYGLYLILKSPTLRQSLAVSLMLLIPSFVSKQLINLNRLVFFEPVIVFIISLGLIKIAQRKKEKVFKLVLFLTIFLVFIQFLVTIFDVNFREYARFERHFGGASLMGEQ